jgi:uncharacterized protein YndB with AHSA1/START domain
MLAQMSQPRSATMLAAAVGLPRQKVNYHLRTLERHGLVELVEERRKGNVTERLLHGRLRRGADPGGDRPCRAIPRRKRAGRALFPPGHRCPPEGHNRARGTVTMGQPFEQCRDAEVPASPEEVWSAIATGPGIDSWFMGRNVVESGAGGTVRMKFGDYTPELDVTAWDPPHRFGHRSETAPDGRFTAQEFLVEGRAGGSTVLRAVTSGFIPGEDWADEYEAMTLGGELYFRTLVEYLTWFRGRFAVPVTAFGPPGTVWERDRERLLRALGLTVGARSRRARVAIVARPGSRPVGSYLDMNTVNWRPS